MHTYQYEVAWLHAFSWQLKQFSVLKKHAPWFDYLVITQLGLQLEKFTKVILDTNNQAHYYASTTVNVMKQSGNKF
jgi:hypothetical protein